MKLVTGRIRVKGKRIFPTPIKELGGVTPRFMQQKLGTEWRDMISRDLWTKILCTRIQTRSKDVLHIIDDTRFWHEVQGLEKQFEVLHVHIHRPGLVKQGSEHASENGLEGFIPHISFVNNGDAESATRFFKYVVTPFWWGDIQPQLSIRQNLLENRE